MPTVAHDLRILPPYAETADVLSTRAVNIIRNDARNALHSRDPLLVCTTDIRIVRDGTQNYINLRVKPQFSNVLYCERGASCTHCFIASDKHEPWVVGVILDEKMQVRVTIPTAQQVAGFERAIVSFLHRFGLQNFRSNLTIGHSQL